MLSLTVAGGESSPAEWPQGRGLTCCLGDATGAGRAGELKASSASTRPRGFLPQTQSASLMLAETPAASLTPSPLVPHGVGSQRWMGKGGGPRGHLRRSTDLGQELRRPGQADPASVDLSESWPSPRQGKVRAAARQGYRSGRRPWV